MDPLESKTSQLPENERHDGGVLPTKKKSSHFATPIDPKATDASVSAIPVFWPNAKTARDPPRTGRSLIALPHTHAGTSIPLLPRASSEKPALVRFLAKRRVLEWPDSAAGPLRRGAHVDLPNLFENRPSEAYASPVWPLYAISALPVHVEL